MLSTEHTLQALRQFQSRTDLRLSNVDTTEEASVNNLANNLFVLEFLSFVAFLFLGRGITNNLPLSGSARNGPGGSHLMPFHGKGRKAKRVGQQVVPRGNFCLYDAFNMIFLTFSTRGSKETPMLSA